VSIISRYMLRHFLPILAIGLFAFLTIYLVVDFFENIDNVIQRQVPMREVGTYLLLKIPFILTQGIPTATLLAVMASLGILNRNRELTALRAAGLSARSYCGPLVVAAAVLFAANLLIGETLARSTELQAKKIWNEKIERRVNPASWSRENIWFQARNLIYRIRFYDKRTQVMERPTLYFLDGDFRLVERLDARRIRWEGGKWVAEEALVIKVSGEETADVFHERLELSLRQTPADFARVESVPQELGWLDLYEYVSRIRAEGYDSTPSLVELHTRVAFPLTTLILAVLGVAVALRQGLHGGMARSVVSALLLATAYLAVVQVGSSLASAGIVPAWLGVWAGNVLFAALGSYLWVTAPQ